jgi:hypothetical protein
MSAINTVTNSIVTEAVVKARGVKKPTLAAKFSRFLIFGYGFVRSLESRGILSAEGVESALSELKLMSAVDEQTEFYTSVISQNKETAKVMRKYVAIRNKPPKAPRAAKAPTEKKARAKKTSRVANDSDVDVVSNVVATVDNKAAAKEAKEAEKAAAKEAKEAEKAAAKAAKEAKDAAKKAVKPVAAPVVVEAPVVVAAPVVVEAPVVAAAAPAPAEKPAAEKKPAETAAPAPAEKPAAEKKPAE